MPDKPIDRLRAATRGMHQRLEELPFSRAVSAGTVALPVFARFLRALAPLVEEVEQRLPALVDVPKARLLAQDLAALRLDRYGVDHAVLRAVLLVQRLRFEEPAFSVGALYVLEGSTLGNLVQRKALSGVLPAGADAYLTVYGAATRSHFEAFVARLEGALPSATLVEAACRGAVATFEAIAAIAEELMRGERAPLGTGLNPGGGAHAIADDLREVRAALAAGLHTWERFPYYEARYGERGRRFTRSDSAWLAGLSPETAQAQLDWLSRVLAARGMPRFLLEDHLFTLHERLCEARPSEAARYAALLAGAERLRAQRRAAVPDVVFDACDAALPGLRGGALLAAATADERCGIPHALDSLQPFLVERFGQTAVARALLPLG